MPSDLIYREDAKDYARHAMAKGLNVLEYLDEVPAADFRPVVLCEDCQYCIKKDDFEYWCNGFCSPARLVCHDDFCSRGKRKERLT